MEKLVQCVRGSLHNWRFMSQTRRTRHLAQDERESRAGGKRKIRAKCRVCLAWPIKRLLCKLVRGDMMSVEDTGSDVCL